MNTIVQKVYKSLIMKQSIKKKNEFMVLRVISSYPRKSQRSLANDLGFSLGKIKLLYTSIKEKRLDQN